MASLALAAGCSASQPDGRPTTARVTAAGSAPASATEAAASQPASECPLEASVVGKIFGGAPAVSDGPARVRDGQGSYLTCTYGASAAKVRIDVWDAPVPLVRMALERQRAHGGQDGADYAAVPDVGQEAVVERDATHRTLSVTGGLNAVRVTAWVSDATAGDLATGELTGRMAAAAGTLIQSAPATTGAAGPSGSTATSAAARYLALGDSLTYGEGALPGSFPALLTRRWGQAGCAVELRNVGVTAYKSADVIADELPAAKSFRPTIATLLVGANDIANGVPLAQYRANVRTILRGLVAAGAHVILLGQNDWYRSPVGVGYGAPEDLAAARARFDAALRDEGAAVAAEYVDLRALYDRQADQNQWGPDGLHPTPAAYSAWADALYAAVPSPCGR